MTLASSLGTRALVLALAVLLALQLLIAGAASIVRVRDIESPARPVIIDQAAAAADLLDDLAPEDRARALRAVSSPFIRFRLIDGYPADEPRGEPLATFRPLISAYATRLGDRPFRVYWRTSGDRRLSSLAAGFRRPRETFVVIRLQDGTALMVEPGGAYVRQQRLGGLAIASSALGALLLAALVWAHLATSRPLRRMAADADRFSLDLAAPPLAEKGPRDVARLARAFNGMSARIRRLVGERTRALAAVAHDLKTYLTRLRMRIEAIPDAEQRGRAARDLEEMTALIDDTLAFARATDASAPREPVVLAQVARSVVAARAEEREAIALEIAPEAEDAAVLGSRAGLARALANLLDNAVRYGGYGSPSGGRPAGGRAGGEPHAEAAPSPAAVEVRVSLDGEDVVLEVRDHGPGVPDTELERLAEPFYRLEPSRSRDTGGSGLGLAIVKAAAEQAGGRLELSNAEGGGLAARVRARRV